MSLPQADPGCLIIPIPRIPDPTQSQSKVGQIDGVCEHANWPKRPVHPPLATEGVGECRELGETGTHPMHSHACRTCLSVARNLAPGRSTHTPSLPVPVPGDSHKGGLSSPQ